jgi:protoheme IX farnesyltransferase
MLTKLLRSSLGYSSTAFSRKLQQNWCKSHVHVSTLSTNADMQIPKRGQPNPDDIYTIRELVHTYGELSKFKLSTLVVITTAAGGVACVGFTNLSTMALACVGTSLCAASAGTFNQVIEVEQDAKMYRTMGRPLPSGKVSIPQAMTFGVATGVCGVSMLALGINSEVAILGASTIALYAVVYTYSKQYTEYNTWMGALVGAIPPVMGCAALTNGTNTRAHS